jgi:hypothetical protein
MKEVERPRAQALLSPVNAEAFQTDLPQLMTTQPSMRIQWFMTHTANVVLGFLTTIFGLASCHAVNQSVTIANVPGLHSAKTSIAMISFYGDS